QQLSQQYGAIHGDMTVLVDGEELTLQQAGVLLQNQNRLVREEVYHKIADRRLQDKDKLNKLFTDLVQLRHKVAQNAGFNNYRDYMFAALGRFDYTAEDCFDFHRAVEEEVVPLLNILAAERKEALRVSTLRAWDKAVDPRGLDP